MPSPGCATPHLCVNDVLAFDDAELVQYMKQNHRLDGAFDLELDGWEKLPKDQRDQLADRLRIGAQKVNDAVQSRPIDPDELATRLHGVADNQDALPQALSGPPRYIRTPTVKLDWDTEGKRRETIAYNALVKDGCRPVYPISRLDTVFNGSEEHDEILLHWQGYTDESDQVFQVQLHRWNMFRRWQQDNREPDKEKEFARYVEEQKRQDTEGTGLEPTAIQYLEQLRDSFTRRQRHYDLDTGDEEFASYVEEKKQQNFQAGCRWPGITEDEYMQMLRNEFKKKQANEGVNDRDEGFAEFIEEKKRKDLEAGRRRPGMKEDEYLQMLRDEFDQEENRRYWREFYWLREDHGRGGFSEYVAEVKRRLARHGVTRACNFDKDPTRQDKLTTWIEYLNYGHSWLDKHARILARLQPDYDKSWQKLLSSGVLLLGETAVELCSVMSAFRRESERNTAEQAVVSAKSAGMTVLEKVTNDPNSRLPEPVGTRMMEEAKSRKDAVEASQRAVTRRCDLISEFVLGASDYMATKKKIRVQDIRLRWIQEQLPLVEADVKEAHVAKSSSPARRTTKRRLEDNGNDNTQERSVKRRKRTHQAGSASQGLSSSTQAKASKHSRLAKLGDGQLSKQSRSNRRVSNLQQEFDNINNAMSTEDVQPTASTASRRRASCGKTSLKTAGGSSSRRQRSTAVQPLAPIKPLRRSPRLAALQDTSRKDTPLPRYITRSRQRSRYK